MNPIIMTLVLILGWMSFLWSVTLKFKVFNKVEKENRFDRLYERIKRTIIYAFAQAKLPRYPIAGIAHMAIFWGFLILLCRSIILWGRGYDESFCLWILCSSTTTGKIYIALKDIAVVSVFIAASVAIINRVINRKTSASRMTHTFEAYAILIIIWVMMVADALYDCAEVMKNLKNASGTRGFFMTEPLGSVLAMLFYSPKIEITTLEILRQAGFWTHSILVLIFLNILPYTKHFHVVTSIPNVFLQNLDHPGHLKKIDNIYDRETYGLSNITRLTWKGILDLYSCTECGRCSDNCPAWTTGKPLSPKNLTIDLRNHLYSCLEEIVNYNEPGRVPDLIAEKTTEKPGAGSPLIPDVIKEEAVWACTTCRACEEECPVFISYVDKILELRRHLVLERGEIPGQLATALHGLENNSNPWNLSSIDRAKWAEGLDVPIISNSQDIDYLLWVGCAPSFDDRAKKVARAMVQLLNLAGVKFAILGEEEKCTGDLARRAGNEALFYELAKANVETLNKYGVKRIITICPHCYNTLAHEYPDWGGYYLVVTHVELLLTLLQKGRLKINKEADIKQKIKKIVYHDSCYLGRYNGIYDQPRQILKYIPEVQLVEASKSRNRGFCCGAGGAQAFKEEEQPRQGSESIASRVNYKRIEQLIETGADTIATACPYCMLMLTDGLKAKDMEEKIKQLDIAEILLLTCR